MVLVHPLLNFSAHVGTPPKDAVILLDSSEGSMLLNKMNQCSISIFSGNLFDAAETPAWSIIPKN